MFQLSNLTSSGKKRKRVGRGGSRGGTAGRGTKGQKARSGSHNRPAHFEGGQMPLVRRLPKRGFNNERFADHYDIINVGQLELWFKDGSEVTKQLLHELGHLKGATIAPLKVLAKGSLTKKLIIHADAVSAAAAQMVASCGGEVRLIKGED